MKLEQTEFCKELGELLNKHKVMLHQAKEGIEVVPSLDYHKEVYVMVPETGSEPPNPLMMISYE